MNRLYFGDNLKWLADRKACKCGSDFPDASVDFVCLDSPLYSNPGCNVLFRSQSEKVSARFWADNA
jgi:hypothetical protein